MGRTPIDDLKIPTPAKKVLKELAREVRDLWSSEVKTLRYRAKVDAQKIKLLHQELKLAEKEILRLQHALEIRR